MNFGNEKNSIYEFGFYSDFGIRSKTDFRQPVSDFVCFSSDFVGFSSDFIIFHRIFVGFRRISSDFVGF